MFDRLMASVQRAGREQQKQITARGILGFWLFLFRPSVLLPGAGACLILIGVLYFAGIRSAATWAEQQAGPGASPAQREALMTERLRLSRSSGLSRTGGWPLQGTGFFYRHLGGVGTLGVFGLGGFSLLGLGWRLRPRTRAGQ